MKKKRRFSVPCLYYPPHILCSHVYYIPPPPHLVCEFLYGSGNNSCNFNINESSTICLPSLLEIDSCIVGLAIMRTFNNGHATHINEDILLDVLSEISDILGVIATNKDSRKTWQLLNSGLWSTKYSWPTALSNRPTYCRILERPSGRKLIWPYASGYRRKVSH